MASLPQEWRFFETEYTIPRDGTILDMDIRGVAQEATPAARAPARRVAHHLPAELDIADPFAHGRSTATGVGHAPVSSGGAPLCAPALDDVAAPDDVLVSDADEGELLVDFA